MNFVNIGIWCSLVCMADSLSMCNKPHCNNSTTDSNSVDKQKWRNSSRNPGLGVGVGLGVKVATPIVQSGRPLSANSIDDGVEQPSDNKVRTYSIAPLPSIILPSYAEVVTVCTAHTLAIPILTQVFSDISSLEHFIQLYIHNDAPYSLMRFVCMCAIVCMCVYCLYVCILSICVYIVYMCVLIYIIYMYVLVFMYICVY